VFAEDEARLLLEAAGTPAELGELVGRRVAGEPLEHLLGWAEFCGLRIAVGPGVFVPRRRTELLVRLAAARVAPGDVVVDLCCGSGAVAVALAAAVPGLEVHAADVDPVAAGLARRNLASGTVHEGDLFDALPPDLAGRVDVLLANVPYVPTDAIATMPPEARLHEPRVALDGGPDGLEVLRRVTAEGKRWLSATGVLLVETSDKQAPSAVEAFTSGGLHATVINDEDVGATVVVGRLA
jgi:release factor glutamine methyltransferase